MVFKCCVPRCMSNCKSGPKKVPIYRFPTDATLYRKWLAAIPRKNFTPTTYSRVCRVHFEEQDIETTAEGFDDKKGIHLRIPLSNSRVRHGAIPSIFPNCPKYYDRRKKFRKDPDAKKKSRENVMLAHVLKESLKSNEAYEQNHRFSSFYELTEIINKRSFSPIWTIVKTDTNILFLEINVVPVPKIVKSLVISNDCKIDIHVNNIPMSKLGKFNFPFPCCNIIDVETILDMLICMDNSQSNVNDILVAVKDSISAIKEVVEEDKKNTLYCITEQLNLLPKEKNSFKYSSEFLILSTILFTISPNAYRFLRSSKFLILPHPNTLKSLCTNFNVNPQDNTNSYIKNKFLHLNNNDKKIVLMVDEIHIKPYLDFKGGKILGTADNSKNPATTAFVFMVQSITSAYKDVVKILPVQKIDAEFLHSVLKVLVCSLESIGFKLICVSSDNNSINRRAMSLFANPPKQHFVYEHPVDHSRPLFYMRDAVHLFKCIRNNWLNQKNSGQCLFYPVFDGTDPSEIKTASFNTIKKVYDIEKNMLVKHCHTLTQKSVAPSNLERQNVKLAIQVFNSSLVEGLIKAGPKYELQHFVDTANFIKIIVSWWEVMNVKSVYKGVHKRNSFQEPLSVSENDERSKFLYSFLDWLDLWKKCSFDTGILSDETHNALFQSTYAIIEISRYCKDAFNMNYILTGKFQTDPLENRFGQYRQLAGGQYHISLTQLVEVEKKLRIQSVLPLQLNSSTFGKIPVEPSDTNDIPLDLTLPKEHVVFLLKKFNFSLDDEDILSLIDIEEIIVYLAGYCVRSCLNRLKCDFCKLNLNNTSETGPTFSLIDSLDRGGLIYPNHSVTEIVSTSYIIITKLLSKDYEKEFLKSSNHRVVAYTLIDYYLNSEEKSLDIEDCTNGHSAVLVQKYLVQSSINIFLKNYSKNINSNLVEASCKKRKLKTLTQSNINNSINVISKLKKSEDVSSEGGKEKSKKVLNKDKKSRKKSTTKILNDTEKKIDLPLNLSSKKKKKV